MKYIKYYIMSIIILKYYKENVLIVFHVIHINKLNSLKS